MNQEYTLAPGAYTPPNQQFNQMLSAHSLPTISLLYELIPIQWLTHWTHPPMNLTEHINNDDDFYFIILTQWNAKRLKIKKLEKLKIHTFIFPVLKINQSHWSLVVLFRFCHVLRNTGTREKGGRGSLSLTAPCGSGKGSAPKFIAIDAHQCTYFNHHFENWRLSICIYVFE